MATNGKPLSQTGKQNPKLTNGPISSVKPTAASTVRSKFSSPGKVAGMNGTQMKVSPEALDWHVGLFNCQNRRYLTSEFFSRRAACSATSLRKKQAWVIEIGHLDKDRIMIRNHEGLYMSTDEYGNVRCIAVNAFEAVEFVIEVIPPIHEHSPVHWRFRMADGPGSLVGDSVGLRIMPRIHPHDKSDQWMVHLATHPQATLLNVARNRYVKYTSKEFRIEETVPWGPDSLMTLEYHDGQYGLKSTSGQYLSRNGLTKDNLNIDCLFHIEYHRGFMALRDYRGWYLTGTGPAGILAARAQNVSRNELFVLEESLPQIYLIASNNKKVSCKGIDLVASKDGLSDYEIFQLEQSMSGNYRLRTVKDTYWSVQHGSGTLTSTGKESEKRDNEFSLDWQADGTMLLQNQPNGKIVTAKANGHMFANANGVGPHEKFMFYIVNRPIMILRSPYGYVSYQSDDVPKMECNHPEHSALSMVPAPHGGCYIRVNGKYLHVYEDCSIWADSHDPTEFKISIRGISKLTLEAPNGKYLTASQTGGITATGQDVNDNTLWEFSGKSPAT